MSSLTALLKVVLNQAVQTAPPAEVEKKHEPAFQPIGKVSVVIDSTVTGADVEVHAIPYVMVELELGHGWNRTGDELGLGARAAPSGLFIDLRDEKAAASGTGGSRRRHSLRPAPSPQCDNRSSSAATVGSSMMKVFRACARIYLRPQKNDQE